MKLLLLLLPISVFSQSNLNGKFIMSEWDFGGFSIDFKDQDTVNYCYWGCMMDYCLKGKYTIGNDSLLLSFTPMKSIPYEDSVFNRYTEHINEKCFEDSVRITVILKDYRDNKGLPFAEIKILTADKSKEFATGYSSFDGKAVFLIPKDEKKYFISTSYVGYHNVIYSLFADKCKSILMEIERHDNYSDPHLFVSQISFRILNYKKKKLVLQDRETQYSLKRK